LSLQEVQDADKAMTMARMKDVVFPILKKVENEKKCTGGSASGTQYFRD
jgi:hypothetical protein